MSNHDFPELRPNPRVRTNTHEPRSFFPRRVNFSSPFFNAAATSSCSGSQVPVSQTITVPPPYSPSGMTPSKLPYSSGWSSTCIASPFYGRIERRAFWNCPGQQDAIEFETKVVMQLRSAMFLHDIQQRLVSPALRVTVGLR